MIWLWVVLAFWVGAGVMWLYNRSGEAEGVPPIVPPGPPDAKLKAAVQDLHKGLFAGFGMPVTGLFNAVWKAAGLEEKGVPPIDDKGRT